MSCCLMNSIPLYFKPLKSSVPPTSLGNIPDLKENLFGIVRVQHKLVQHIMCKKSCSNSFPKLTARAPCWLELWILRSISLEVDALWGKVWKGQTATYFLFWWCGFQFFNSSLITSLLICLAMQLGSYLSSWTGCAQLPWDPHGRWSDTTFGTCLVIGKFLKVDHKSTQLMILSHWERYWLNLWLANNDCKALLPFMLGCIISLLVLDSVKQLLLGDHCQEELPLILFHWHNTGGWLMLLQS